MTVFIYRLAGQEDKTYNFFLSTYHVTTECKKPGTYGLVWQVHTHNFIEVGREQILGLYVIYV